MIYALTNRNLDNELQQLQLLLRPIQQATLLALIACIARRHAFSALQFESALALLAAYPEDLVCAAYHHVMTSAPPSHFHEIIRVMMEQIEPELDYRRKRLNQLLAQHVRESA
jgi:hypothetical protein